MATSTSVGSSLGQSASGTQVLPQLQSNYNQLLNLNQNRYQNVLGAYQNTQAQLNQQLPGLYNGYGNIENQVTGTLGLNGGGWGVAAPAAAAISRTLTNQNGANLQGLVSSGLGNSTILGNMQNQNAYNATQAYGNLGAQLAQTAAGYQSQIGLARQNAQLQGMGMQNQLGAGLGSSLAGINFANTAGGLTGGYSTSSNSSQNVGTSYAPGAGGAGSGQSPTSGLQTGDLFHPFGAYGQASQGLGSSGGVAGGGYAGGTGYYSGGNGLQSGYSSAPGAGFQDELPFGQGLDWQDPNSDYADEGPY